MAGYLNGPNSYWVRSEEVRMKMAIWIPLAYATVAGTKPAVLGWGLRTVVGPQRRGERIKLTALFSQWLADKGFKLFRETLISCTMCEMTCFMLEELEVKQVLG